MIEEIIFKKRLYAIIIRNKFSKDGAFFATKSSLSQQMAHMKYKKGHKIRSHFHKRWIRNISTTVEALFIKKGKLRIDFYTTKGKYFLSKVISEKDTLLTLYGGHGFEVIKNVSMIEIKQGPFTKDTRKFLPFVNKKKIKNNKIKLNNDINFFYFILYNIIIYYWIWASNIKTNKYKYK